MTSLHVLLAEDNEDDALLLTRELERGGFQPIVERIESEPALREALSRAWDLILCDYSMPGFSGGRAIEIIREHDGEVPVIVVSGTIGEEIAVDALRAGASDYVMKGSLTRLVPAVRRELAESHTRRVQAKLADELDRSQRRFRVTFEQAPVGIAIVDSERNLVEVNTYLTRMLGYERQEVLGRSISSLTAEGDREATLQAAARVAAGGPPETIEKEYVRRDGSRMVGRTTISMLEGDREKHYLGIIENITAEREAAQRLHFQARLLDCVEQAVIACGADGRIVYANRFAEQLYGWRADELTGLNIAETAPWRASKKVPDEVFARLREGESWSGEVELLRRDGSTFPGWVTDSPITNSAGKPIGVVSVSHDMTYIKGAEEERQRTQHELRIAAQRQIAVALLARRSVRGTSSEFLQYATELAIRHLDVESCCLYTLDPRSSTLTLAAGLGLSEGAQTLPADWTTHIGAALSTDGVLASEDYATENRFDTSDFLANGVAAGMTVAIRGDNAPFGTLGVFTSRPRKFTEPEERFLQALADAVAEAMERDAAQQALIASEERYRTVVEGASEVIYTIDAKGVITSLNAAFGRITGWSREEWIGRPFIELMAEEDHERSLKTFESLIRGERIDDLDFGLRNRDGGTTTVRVSAAPMWKDGRFVGLQGFGRDMTQARRAEAERERLEQQLAQATRLTSLGRLAATIAHEFNNVLMGISPFVEVLRRPNTTPERTATALEHIGSAIKRGKRITDEILRYTRPSPPVIERVPVSDLRKSLFTELKSVLSAAYDVRVDAPDPSLAVMADAAQLHQIISNLVLNARDAMPEGGTIQISFEQPRPGDEYEFGIVASPERFVRISVTDSGCGIPAEMLPHVFEPLFTTKRTGTGLGLAVTHQVVRQHNGEIFIESTPGKGTTFHIFLPAAEVTAQQSPTSSAPEIQLPARKLLLVEDDVNVATGITLMLQDEGVDVTTATTGAEVMPAIRERRPDIVLLDIGLPDIEGTKVYALIAAEYPDLPVVFSTGHGDQRKIEHYLERGNVAMLLKPYTIETLLETLARVQQTGAA